MKLNTLSYVLGAEDTIETDREYYFGQLWDGDGDGDELLEDKLVSEAEFMAQIVKNK